MEENYILPELLNIQQPSGNAAFEDVLSMIEESMDIPNVGKVISKLSRFITKDPINDYLKSLILFRDIEARLRFSIWHGGEKAPPHFSKLLNRAETRRVLPSKIIKILLAFMADPKGLNLRNIAAHGYSLSVDLSLPVLENLTHIVYPLLGDYVPPKFDFNSDISVLKFHSSKINLIDEVRGPETILNSKIMLKEAKRIEAVKKAYELYYHNEYSKACILLFPIFEHSLRVYAVDKLGVSSDRKCASSDEHFFSIKDAIEALPEDLAPMLIDLHLNPVGPTLRGRLFHGASEDFPKELAVLVFDMFERCCLFSDGKKYPPWRYAFHPSRQLEYALYQACGVEGLDLLERASPSYARLTECVLEAKLSSTLTFKEEWANELLKGNFINLIATTVLYVAQQPVKDSTLTHLLAIAHAPAKYAALGCSERLESTVCSKLPFLRKYNKDIPEKVRRDDLFILGSKELLLQAINTCR